VVFAAGVQAVAAARSRDCREGEAIVPRRAAPPKFRGIFAKPPGGPRRVPKPP